MQQFIGPYCRHGREPERPRDGRSRFDEKPPPVSKSDEKPQDGGKEADGKPPRGRENRWEGSDADRSLPGPPPQPPPRREGDTSHPVNNSSI